MLPLLFILAAIGFALSVIAHVSTFFGADPRGQFPYIWLLHIGIFVVFGPAVVLTNRRREGRPKADDWQSITRVMPRWVRALFSIFGIYVLLNFVLFMAHTTGGEPTAKNGKFVLESHGRLIREINEDEYRHRRGYTIRGFSGHWMVFYGGSMGMLYSLMKPVPELSR